MVRLVWADWWIGLGLLGYASSSLAVCGLTPLGEAVDHCTELRSQSPTPLPQPMPLLAPPETQSPTTPLRTGSDLQPPPPPDPRQDPNVHPARGGEIKFSGRVVARVNGVPILEEDAISAAMSQLLMVRQSNLPAAEKARLERQIIREEIEQLIDREVLLHDAFRLVPQRALAKAKDYARKEFELKVKQEMEQLKISSPADYEALLESLGISLEYRRRQFERNFIASEYLRNRVRARVENIAFDREQLLEYYEKNPQEFNPPESIEWLHVFINKQGYPSEEEGRRKAEAAFAEAIKCKTREDFAALAERVSDGPVRRRKGEGEGTERGKIRPPELEETLFKMAPGDVSPLLETKDGYHILLLVRHHPGGKIPFEKACPTIRTKLQNQAATAEFQRFIKELRGKAYIEMANR